MKKPSILNTIVVVSGYCAGISLIAGAVVAAMNWPIVKLIWTDETDK